MPSLSDQIPDAVLPDQHTVYVESVQCAVTLSADETGQPLPPSIALILTGFRDSVAREPYEQVFLLQLTGALNAAVSLNYSALRLVRHLSETEQ